MAASTLMSALDFAPPHGEQFEMASSKNSGRKSPVAHAERPKLLDYLRLENQSNFTFESFQSFCLAVVESVEGVERCVEFGVNGDTQEGVDLVATMKDGTTWAIQCKQRARFSESDAAKAAAKATYKAHRYSIFLSRPASVGLARWGLETQAWDVWDARSISAAVRKMDPDKSSRLLRYYFTGEVARSFDGLAGPTPFMRANDYFGQLQGSKASLDYSTPLIGRDAALASLMEWSRESAPPVAILAGRGGVGKTRLLIEFERRASQAGILAWCMDSAAADLHEIHSLPQRDCVVIVDDAHRSPDIVKAVTALRAQRKHALLPLLVSRTDGTGRLRSQLADQRIEAHGVRELERLEDLSREDCEELAVSVLGENMRSAGEAIAQLAAGSPLVTVLAASVVKRDGENVILRSPNFRSTVMGRFYGDKLVGGPDVDEHLARRIIALVAALEPLEEGELSPKSDFLPMLARHLEAPVTEVRRTVTELERAGILRRARRELRIYPDVLSDFLLEEASVLDGQSTGFAAATIHAFPDCTPRLVRNFAYIDWVMGGRLDDIDDLWKSLETKISGTSWFEAEGAVRLVEGVAGYQPARALRFVRAARPHVGKHTLAIRLMDGISKILATVGWSFEHVGQVCSLLWELGVGDDRDSARHPWHPHATLGNLAKFDRDRPVRYNRELLAWVRGRWPQPASVPHEVARILGHLLAKGETDTRSWGSKLRMSSFMVETEAARELAAEAAGLLEQIALHAPTRTSAVAITQLEKGAADIEPYPFLDHSAEASARFLPERLTNVARLERIATARGRGALAVHLRSELQHLGAHGTPPTVRTRLRELVRGLPDDQRERLFGAVVGRWEPDEDVSDDGYKVAHARWQDMADEVARELTRLEPSEICERLEAVLEELSEVIDGDPANFFFWRIGAVAPRVAFDLARVAIEAQSQRVGRNVGVLLHATFEKRSEEVVEAALRAVATGSVPMAQGIAEVSVGWRELPPALFEPLLDALLSHSNDLVRETAARTIVRAGELRQDELERLLALVETDSKSAEAAFRRLDEDRLDERALQKLLEKLVLPNSISSYGFRSVIERGVDVCPEVVIDMLLARCERELALGWGRAVHYRATECYPPWSLDLGTDERTRALERILAAAATNLKAAQYSPHVELFALVARPDWQEATTLLEALVARVEADGLALTMYVLHHAPEGFAASNLSLTEACLTRAARDGEQPLERCMDALVHSSLKGGCTWTGNEEPPKYVQLEKRSRELAVTSPPGSLLRRFFERTQQQAREEIERWRSIEESMD